MEDVKGPEGRRARKARQTRETVLTAAEVLFAEHGYAGTSIAAVAAQADVAVQTVYAQFGNKRTLLSELLQFRTRGAADDTALTASDAWRAMEAEPDPRRQLEQLAAIAAAVGARLGALYDVLAAAAGAEPEIAALFRAQQQSRHDDQARVTRALDSRGVLRPDLDAGRATDVMWAIANPRTHRTLVHDRGWSHDQYTAWLGDLLIRALLREDS